MVRDTLRQDVRISFSGFKKAGIGQDAVFDILSISPSSEFGNGRVRSLTVPFEHIPEPTTVALLGIGIAGLAVVEVRRRRKKKV